MTNNITKKQLYQEKRQQKFEAKEQAHKEKKKDNTLLLVAILVPLVLIGGIIVYGFYAQKSSVMTKEIGEFLPDQGRTHIKAGEVHPAYNSNPPASGWHYDDPVDWGVYKNEQVEERLVHNLEHGGIVIQYKPTLDSATIAKLEELKKSKFECKLVVAPFDKLDKNIALTAWRRLYKNDTFDEKTIKEFIQQYHDRAPESVPCSQ